MLEQHRLEMHRPPTHELLFCPWVLHSWTPLISNVGWSMDKKRCGFWHWGMGSEASSHRHPRMTREKLGGVRVMLDFQRPGGWCFQTPHCSRVSCNLSVLTERMHLPDSCWGLEDTVWFQSPGWRGTATLPLLGDLSLWAVMRLPNLITVTEQYSEVTPVPWSKLAVCAGLRWTTVKTHRVTMKWGRAEYVRVILPEASHLGSA